MTTLVWTNTNERAITIAGTNSVIAELLTAIKAAVDNDSTLWQTSDYSAGNGTLEIKRKGSPTGEQATVRFLFFGGQTPNAAAITVPAPTLNATTLYCALSVDANTTGPSASYASAAPYSTKYVKGNVVCLGNALASAGLPRVCLVESDDALTVCLHDSTAAAVAICGRVVDDVASSTSFWCCFVSSGAYSNTTIDSTFNSAGVAAPMPAFYNGGQAHAGYWNATSSTTRSTGRLNGLISGTAGPTAGSNGAASTLIPIVVGDSAVANSATIQFLGYARQIRLGPQAQNLNTLRDISGTVQAIHLGIPMGSTGYGLWFDQVA